MLTILVCIAALQNPATPIEFGRRDLDAELSTIDTGKYKVDVRIDPKGQPESYRIDVDSGGAHVYGADPAGAMYGQLELAERIRMSGVSAFQPGKVEGKPYVRDRGLNLFLTLPWDYQKNDTDYDPAALTDPKRWWFQNEDYWTTLLDLMARSRFNWLDIHGSWDISVTDAPNLYAYFIQSDKYPKVGVDPAIKAANLKQLNHVIQMAHARGIRVSLMSYEARLRTPQNPKPPYEETEKLLYDYTREMVEKMIRQAPGLDAIGFRIGESGKGEEFFNCYHEAVKRSGRDIPLITRSWITRKQNVVPLARKSSDFTVEIKYNGEQWGAPYMVAGGRVPNWYSYAFEDYLSDSGAPGKKMWPGNETEEGGQWPSEPYKIVWQVRANGTHRIFPFYNPDWVRRTIATMKIGTASGYTIEGNDAYYPKSPRYYLANPDDQYCDWIHQRDEMYWMTWGRLGYDPTTPFTVFDHRMKELFGDYAKPVSEVWKMASEIIPTAFMGYALGPDHRSQAPELELGGNRMDFMGGVQAQDEFSFKSIKEAFAYEATGGTDFREIGTANELGEWLDRRLPDLSATDAARPMPKRVKEIYSACRMLRSLARYYMNRHIDAMALASSPDPNAGSDAMRNAREAWGALSNSREAKYYRPFTERLRMHTNTYHWESKLAELMTIKGGASPRQPQNYAMSGDTKRPMPELWLTWREENGQIVVGAPGMEGWLLYKPLPSSTYFHKVRMARVNGALEARLPRERYGYMLAADVRGQSGNPRSAAGTWSYERRIPSPWDGAPYVIVPSKPGPTPLLYNASEAPTYLRPDAISPDRYGLMVIGTRASAFLGQPVSLKRKVLNAVERGVTLVIFQQDFARHTNDWLPKPLRVQSAGLDTFDPGGALGMKPAEGEGMLYQRFLTSDGWQIHGNGGLASMKHGKGEIWVTSARLMQNMHLADAPRAMLRLLKLGDPMKPVVLIDSGSEGGDLTDSVFPDMMNAHEISFKTLGEVIVDQQGMNSATPVAGLVWDDSVMQGNGARMMTRFLEAKVKAAAARPIPKNSAELEARKPAMRRELMRGLGLEPLPARTPLNARITGGFERAGYRVENIVLDSRPGFPVSANLYIPKSYNGQKLPVLVNPHGHWQWKKSQGVVQQRAIFQALQGYVAIVVDSPGWSFEGDTPVERRWAGTHNDFSLILGSANATAIYVWDLMRVMDYLETRPETDMSRVGITGASGGGLATLYAFAAEPRFKAAVPVVYASSMEVEPHNGCLCNHVPGTLQIGDRSDVLAIRAPAPVYVIGATNDGEFPPAGTQLTGEKLKKLWGLYGKQDDTGWQIFPGPHDYNLDMQAQAIQFFNHHLKGAPANAVVNRPVIVTEPQDSKELVCLPSPPAGLRTMRDIAAENLAKARPMSFEDVATLNGGLPKVVPLEWKEIETSGRVRHVTFTSEAGLTLPGVLRLPSGRPKSGIVLVDEGGKTAAEKAFEAEKLVAAGYATLAIDVRGYGEMGGLDPRLMAYLGTADAFAMGWDAARAADGLRKYAPTVGVFGRGAVGSQVAMFSALMSRKVSFVAGVGGIHEYADVFQPGVSEAAIQPRAMYGAPLSHLRSLVKARAEWTFLDGTPPDTAHLIRLAGEKGLGG